MPGQDHRPLPLESRLVYGPLFSRRLGISLGINLLPARRKVCSFDCVYCHYGVTDVMQCPTPPADAVNPASEAAFPSVEAVLRALEPALRRNEGVTALTFSGNGEPTLHPYFAAVVFEVRRLRDRIHPQAQLALFSNATTVLRPDIRSVLETIDRPILKLDAGDPVTFAAVNRPAPGVDLEGIIAGMKTLGRLTTQTVLIDGPVSNARDAALDAWVDALADVHPDQAQIYSTDYPVPDRTVQRVPPFVLRRLAAETQARTGVPVKAYWLD